MAEPNRYRLEGKHGRVRCYELIHGEKGPEVASELNFARLHWERDFKKCLSAPSRPLVTVPLQPKEMPAALNGMPADSELVLRDPENQYDIFQTAAEAREHIGEAIERQRLGVINIYEAAALLEATNGGSRVNHLEMLRAQLSRGLLKMADPRRSMVTVDVGAELQEWRSQDVQVHIGELSHFWVTTLDAVNKCLDQVDELGLVKRLGPSHEVVAEKKSVPERDFGWLQEWNQEKAEIERGRGKLHGAKAIFQRRIAKRDGESPEVVKKGISSAEKKQSTVSRAIGSGAPASVFVMGKRATPK